MAKSNSILKTPNSYSVYIRLLGSFEIENGLGRIVEENPHKRNYAWPLLKYLIINRGREVEQHELLGSVWPERTSDEIASTDRVRLNRLRAYLKPLDLSGRHGLVLYQDQKYALNPLYDIQTDADEFTELVVKIRNCPVEDPQGLKLCGKALELYRGSYLKYTKKDFWFDKIQESYDEEFCYLAFNTVDRILATGNDKLLTLLSRRALDMLPADLELHKAILNCFSHFGRDAERKRHTTQLMRSDVIANWLSSM